MIKLDYNDLNAEYRDYKYDTKEDYEIARGFDKKLSKVYDSIREDMMEWLPNLDIYISPKGELSLWVRSLNQAIKTPQEYNVGGLHSHQIKFLLWVNDKVKAIVNEPDKYFWCTECGTVQPMDNFKANVFSGYYCNDCYNNNKDVKDIVNVSDTPGFYD